MIQTKQVGRRLVAVHLLYMLPCLLVAACAGGSVPAGRYHLDLEQTRRLQQDDRPALSGEQDAALAPLLAGSEHNLPESGSLVLENGRFALVLSVAGRSQQHDGTLVRDGENTLLQRQNTPDGSPELRYRIRWKEPSLLLFVDASDIPRLVFRRVSD